MSAIGSVNNSYNAQIATSYQEEVTTVKTEQPQTTAKEGAVAGSETVDTMETGTAKPAAKPQVNMTTQGALVDPNYFTNSGLVSHGSVFTEQYHRTTTWESQAVGKPATEIPTSFKGPEDFNNWIHDNLASPEDVTRIWNSWKYDNAHCMDAFAYTVLESFAKKGGVCREDAITKTYMLNELGYEAKAVAYGEPDCFHVVSFFKDEDGKWNIAEYGQIHKIGADSFEEALVQALPNGNNFWIWSDADADKSAYVAKRVRTHQGLELTGFITGQDKTNGNIIFADKGISIGLDNEKATIHTDLGKGWSLDGRYNFSGREFNGLSGIGGNMGGQNGSVWAAVRKDMGNNLNLSLAYGYAHEMGLRNAGRNYSSQKPMHMLALGATWNTNAYSNSWNDGKLRFSSDFDAVASLPFYFHNNWRPEYLGMLVMDLELDATSHNRLEYDVSKDFTLNAGYTASLDMAQSIENLLMSRLKYWAPPAINQYAEIGGTFHTNNFALSGNVYMPITIFDTKYNEDFLWNVQANANLGKDWKLGASVSGGFKSDNSLVNIKAGVTYKDKVNVSFSAENLNTNFKTTTLGLSFGINF